MASRRSSWFNIALLVALTEAVYFRRSVLSHGLLGLDYSQLHARHIAFAREALFGPGHYLPGWYPRELLGAPFAANIQSFPWIPTRLILLLLAPQLVYEMGVALAAGLASVFTYLFCKRAGLSGAGRDDSRVDLCLRGILCLSSAWLGIFRCWRHIPRCPCYCG